MWILEWLNLKKITTINPAGDYQIEKLDGEPILDETANMKVMKKVFEELQQFYRAWSGRSLNKN